MDQLIAMHFTSAALTLAQAAPDAQSPAPAPPAPAPGQPTGTMTVEPAGGPAADFQPYIFWAYSGVCVLLFLFTLWTLFESKSVSGRLRYLQGRFREAHPGEADDGS